MQVLGDCWLCEKMESRKCGNKNWLESRGKKAQTQPRTILRSTANGLKPMEAGYVYCPPLYTKPSKPIRTGVIRGICSGVTPPLVSFGGAQQLFSQLGFVLPKAELTE